MRACCCCAQIWDLGGQQNLRPFWATYYKKSDAVIMVVDSTDRARVSVCKVGAHNFRSFYCHDPLAPIPA